MKGEERGERGTQEEKGGKKPEFFNF